MNKIASFKVGDVIKVYQKILEGKKERVISFRGQVLKIKGSGVNKMFTVREVLDGISVDKIFPIQSPTIEKVEFIESPKKRVRRANLVKHSNV